MSTNLNFKKFLKSCDAVAQTISRINSPNNLSVERYVKNRKIAAKETSQLLENAFSEKIRNSKLKEKKSEIRKAYRSDIQGLIDHVFEIKDKCVIQ